MKTRTWPVFVVGAGALLLLIGLPGVAALRQSRQIYDEIRSIQQSHENTQLALSELERRILQMSVAVRDFLLDDAPRAESQYRQQVQRLRSSIDVQLADLAVAAPDEAGMFRQLREELRAYGQTIEPVLEWTPEERLRRGRSFLREQQRPRRQVMLTIADGIRKLNADNYQRRYEDVNASQRRSRRQLEIAIAVAFLLGLVVAGATVSRIFVLERQSEAERAATLRAEHELRGLSSRLRSAQEEERRTISRELHDEVGQMITGLRMELGVLDKLGAGLGQEFGEHSAEAKLLAAQALRTIRDIAVGLRPSVLDLGLEPALQWQARHFSRRTGTDASVEIDGQLPSLPDSYLTCIYRIVQEALTNTARHARANRISVRVSAGVEALEVVIRDDGIGFRENWTSSRGLGLIGIEERAREIGGNVGIESERGEGAVIRVHLPVPHEVTA